MEFILALLGGIGQAAGGVMGTVAQFQAAMAKDELNTEKQSFEKESLAKSQAIRGEEETWMTQDLTKQYQENKKSTLQGASNKGLISSSVLNKKLNQLSEDLSTTLQRRARAETLRTGFENFSLAGRQGLETKALNIENQFGEAQGAAQLVGGLGSMASAGAGYMSQKGQMDKENKLYDTMMSYYSR